MVAAGLFHLGRGGAVDGVVFLGPPPHWRPPSCVRRANPAAAGPGAAVLIAIPAGWLVAAWRPGTVPVAVAVAVDRPADALPRAREGRPRRAHERWHVVAVGRHGW